jgi:BMFP domain-containing protein YqiC
MQTRNSMLDDLARVAAGALGVAAGMRKEAEELLRQRFASVMASEDFVTREEFDAVKAMAAKARAANEALEARMVKLEAGVPAGTASKRPTPMQRTAEQSVAEGPSKAAGGPKRKTASPARGRKPKT